MIQLREVKPTAEYSCGWRDGYACGVLHGLEDGQCSRPPRSWPVLVGFVLGVAASVTCYAMLLWF